MALWERYQGEQTLVTLGSHHNRELLYNEEDTDNFQQADLVVVDGIVTLHTDTDDLVGARLLVLHDSILTGVFNENDPSPDDPQVYYNFFIARGPLPFRLRSKKTIPPSHKLWLQLWKAAGTTSTVVRFGVQVYLQLKH